MMSNMTMMLFRSGSDDGADETTRLERALLQVLAEERPSEETADE